MSIKVLVIIASLVVFCLCQPEKKVCARPSKFKGAQDVKMYVECVKALTSPVVYGKRSAPTQSIILQKLQDASNDYDEDCARPSIFKDPQDVFMYLECLRVSKSSVLYGKGSVQPQRILIQKPLDIANDYDEDNFLIHNLRAEPNYNE